MFEDAEEEYEAAHYTVTEDAIDSTGEAYEIEDEDEKSTEMTPAEGEIYVFKSH